MSDEHVQKVRDDFFAWFGFDLAQTQDDDLQEVLRVLKSAALFLEEVIADVPAIPAAPARGE